MPKAQPLLGRPYPLPAWLSAEKGQEQGAVSLAPVF
jgi:hypothetical protein